MERRFIVAGTDTGIGKTVVSAMLAGALRADYWKPVQSGLDGATTDTETVRLLSGLPEAHFYAECYRLAQPLSPHRAAELDGVAIDPATIFMPKTARTLLIEGAGGLMVPLTRKDLQIDLFRHWAVPVILCARTELGTINHTLLSIEALRVRGMALHGIIFVGEDRPDTIDTIADFTGAKILGRLPFLDPLTADSLQCAFADNFRREDFA